MSQQPKVPTPPSVSKTYQQGIDVYLKNLPTMLQQELAYRQTQSPQYLAAQQALQKQFGPQLYASQLAALGQLDPYGTALRQMQGRQITADLAAGRINPQQAQLYNRIMGQAGAISPQQSALYNQLSAQTLANLQRGGIDPNQIAAYRALGQADIGQLARGYTQDPAALQQEIQAIE